MNVSLVKKEDQKYKSRWYRRYERLKHVIKERNSFLKGQQVDRYTARLGLRTGGTVRRCVEIDIFARKMHKLVRIGPTLKPMRPLDLWALIKGP